MKRQGFTHESTYNKELKTLIVLLDTYSSTSEMVSQQFYQGLCEKAKKTIIQLKKQLDCLGEIVILNYPEAWEYYLEDIKKLNENPEKSP